MYLYQYIFYKIYKLIEKPDFSWWSDFRASFLISMIECSVLVLLDFKLYKYTGIGGIFNLGKWPFILILSFPPIIVNHLIFVYNDRWKKIVNYFDKLGRKETSKLNRLLTLIVFSVICLIVFLIYI